MWYWQLHNWQMVVFTDASRYCLFAVDGRQRVYRRRGDRAVACCGGGGSDRAWWGVCRQERTPLVILNGNLTAQLYVNYIPSPTDLPFLQLQLRGDIYQHDNARPHTARIIQNVIGVNVLPWPVCSQDMSPVQHLWNVMGHRFRHPHPPARKYLGHPKIMATYPTWPHLTPDIVYASESLCVHWG